MKPFIPYVEFYITHNCNLSCPGCNRFNNYAFSGIQRWNDYKDIYKKWANNVDIGNIAILGGEPLLNVGITDWIIGIRKLWPHTGIRLISNGFLLKNKKNLYEVLNKNKINLWVGIHNKQHKKEIINIIKEFSEPPHTYKFLDDDPYNQQLIISDSNNFNITVEYNWWFHQGSIINNNGLLTLHNSDPLKAHNICHMKTCHHFYKGQLYKCGVAAILPDFNDQHKLLLSKEDKELLMSYIPLSCDAEYSNIKNFIDNLSNPIDQCKFCPEVYYGDMIFAQKKKQ